jgi:CHAD domain-containing protein
VKARSVDGLDPGSVLGQAARRIVGVRVAELYSLASPALDARDTAALHDLRIAAKRLRYVLEVIGFCLDDSAGEAALRVRELQTQIGAIHDLDVLLVRVDAVRHAQRKGARRLARRLRDQRAEQFVQFEALWAEINASGLQTRLVAATNPSPGEVPMSA